MLNSNRSIGIAICFIIAMFLSWIADINLLAGLFAFILGIITAYMLLKILKFQAFKMGSCEGIDKYDFTANSCEPSMQSSRDYSRDSSVVSKQTILGKIVATIRFSENIQESAISYFHSEVENFFKSSIEPMIRDAFLASGISKNNLPRLIIFKSGPESNVLWKITGHILVDGTIGEICEDLHYHANLYSSESNNKISISDYVLTDVFSKDLNKSLTEHLGTHDSVPSNILSLNMSVDLSELDKLLLNPKSHNIYLKVGISADSIYLENLGKESMKNIRLGISKNKSKGYEWMYAESYRNFIEILPAHEKTLKNIGSFKNLDNISLSLSESPYVDCWIEDSYGIYLLNFYLDNPHTIKFHTISLNVSISKESLYLENIGENAMENVKIGIFKGNSKRNRWIYADSFTSHIDILSSNQKLIAELTTFENLAGVPLDISDEMPLYIDCWVQDMYGICLFMFYLTNGGNA